MYLILPNFVSKKVKVRRSGCFRTNSLIIVQIRALLNFRVYGRYYIIYNI